MAFKMLAVAAVAVFLAFVSEEAASQAAGAGGLNQVCLGCICEAASGCNTTIGCVGDICGPFHITWGYWSDSGKPTLNGQPASDNNAYANCVNDAYCAARAVQGYMEKYSQDCNNDGTINCDDYARIHYLGGYGCGGALEKRYENAYYNCRNSFAQ
ncbi:hypothetical protein TSAR_014505 [Trichomalopsis sarcophagae]|uniref:lysozyme n=1 Tax=Trichomalopsis sarcophagae TaxID=543379 RepID=A0A232EEH8_9HYME|nr:hypothetical protein TSAR_014505 [Trichomalopsis sarcophagae]